MKNYFLLIALIVITILFKIIPHTPNFSPQLVLLVYLGSALSKKNACLLTLIILIGLDFLTSRIGGYSMFGSWTIFTYSAFIFIVLLTHFCKVSVQRLSFVLAAGSASIGFWLWTNLESWLFSGMYSVTIDGLITCYTLALPFLSYSLLASLLWGLLVVLLEKYFRIDYSSKLHYY